MPEKKDATVYSGPLPDRTLRELFREHNRLTANPSTDGLPAKFLQCYQQW